MTGEEAIPVSEHDILTEGECAGVRDAVLALRDHWTQRGQGGFFTLGTASYLDAPNQRDAYLGAARATNPVLFASFEGLLERVRLFFEGFLGEPVCFDQRYALPGFHVYVLHGGDRSQDNPARRAHFDLQWMHVFPEHVPAATLSFTLAIEEPTGGASMALWHARYQDALDMGFTAGQYASSHPWQTLQYTRGRIVVHDGLILHAIGTARITTPKGLRMTVQGHGLRLPAGWVLYW